MRDLWHKAEHSCCIHQAKRPVLGHAAVLESWIDKFRGPRRGRGRGAEYETQSVVIRENIGRVVVVSEGKNEVITNFFERTPHGWKLWCHQVGSVEPLKQQ